MTESEGVLLDRVQLGRAFTALGERLVQRGVVADVFVVGGAAMALAYDATRVTRDVDSLFVPHGVVLEEARNVARDLGLPPWWLNEQASVYISGKDDPGKRRVFDHPGLRVTTASPRHVFAAPAAAVAAGLPPSTLGTATAQQRRALLQHAVPRGAACYDMRELIYQGTADGASIRSGSAARHDLQGTA